MVNPRLWIAPLIGMISTFFILALIFGFSLYYAWPSTPGAGSGGAESVASWFYYSWKVIFAFGVASFLGLVFWLFFFPVVLNFAFGGMIKKTYLQMHVQLGQESIVASNLSNFYILYKTLGVRILWPVLTIVFVFAFPPLSMVFAQIGIGHLAMIDGCDLSMSFLGLSGRERMEVIQQHRGQILLAGVIAGIMSFILLPTFILWIFWIPGIFVGASFLSLKWLKREN